MIVFRSPSPWLLPIGKLNVDWSRAPRGLAACFTGNGYIDVAQNKHFNFYQFGSRGAGPVPTPRGLALSPFPPNDYGGSTIQFNPNAGGSMEAVFLCTTPATAQSFCNFFNNTVSSGGQGASAVPGLGIVSSKLSFYFNSSFVNFGGATTLTAGRVYHAVATWDGSGNATLYLDGVSDGTGSGTIQSNAAPASFNLGVGYQGNPLSPIILATCANVQWSADEVKQRFLDPFGFLTSAEGEWPALFVAGGGGGSFLAAWAMNSNLPVIGTGTY
jgi:hypothetical protein